MDRQTSASALTGTGILYTDGHFGTRADTMTHGYTKRQTDSNIPLKTFILQGYKEESTRNVVDKKRRQSVTWLQV